MDPTLPARLEHEKSEVDALFNQIRTDDRWNRSSPFGLVEAALWFISRRLD